MEQVRKSIAQVKKEYEITMADLNHEYKIIHERSNYLNQRRAQVIKEMRQAVDYFEKQMERFNKFDKI